MKNYILLLLIIIFSCKQPEKELVKYPTIDYLIVKQKLDTINTTLNTKGYSPTMTFLKNKNKELIFFGTSHVRDITHPQFLAIEDAFNKLQPQIAFNEGGQIEQDEHYSFSRDSSILQDGETGLLKFLCDKNNISLMNGDMSTDEEFKGLLNKFPREQIYLYLGIERFLQPYSQGFAGNSTIEEYFQKNFIAYLEKYKFNLTAQEKNLSYLYNLYNQYFKQKIDLKNLINVHEYYLLDKETFGKIGRTSKEIRDQVLLTKIDSAFNKYDKIFIVFGASHWVAVQPALKYIIYKKRYNN